MTLTKTAAKFNVGSTISGSGRRQVQTDFADLPGEDAPLPAWIGYGPSQKVGSDYKFEWIVGEAMPTTLTGVTINSSDTSMTLTSATEANQIQVGQILKLEDENVRVATINTTTGAITFDARGGFGTTAAAHTAPYTIRIMAPQYLDSDSFVESAKARGDFKFNYPAQFMWEWTENAMRSAVDSYLVKGSSELAYERTRKMLEIAKNLEASLLYSYKQQPTASAVGSFDGILAQIQTNITNVGGTTIPLTASDIINTLENVVQYDNGRKSFTIITNRKGGRILDSIWNQYFDRTGEPTTTELGVVVDMIHTSHGDIGKMVCQQLDDGKMLILKQDDLDIVPIDTDFGSGWQEFTRDPQQTNTLERQMAYWGMFSFKMGNEKQHAYIRNFSTTLSDYAGVI